MGLTAEDIQRGFPWRHIDLANLDVEISTVVHTRSDELSRRISQIISRNLRVLRELDEKKADSAVKGEQTRAEMGGGTAQDFASRAAEAEEGAGLTATNPWDLQPGDSPSSEYIRTLRLLAQGGGTRAEAAARFRAIAEQLAGSRDGGETAGELAVLLEEMAEEDRRFKEPEDLSALSEGQLIDYYVYKLRDVAAVQHARPGKCFVLYYNQLWLGEKDDNAALKLRKMGKAVVPRLIELLDDRRPTRSMGGSEGTGEHLLRYGDVALQVIEAIAGREFDANVRPRGVYLVDSGPAARDAIIGEVKNWWNENKDRTEAEWIRGSLLESGTGLGSGWNINQVKAASRLIEIEGGASTDFFRQLLKAEPDCDDLVGLLWQAGGKAVLDDIRPKAASGNFFVRMAAYRALMEAGEPGIVEKLISELDEFVKKPRDYDRRPIDLLILSDRQEGVLAAARLLGYDNADVVEMALASFKVMLETEDMPSPGLRRLVFPYMASKLDADASGQPASDWQKQVAAGWLIKAAGLPYMWPSEPSKAKYEAVVEQVRSWWAQQTADSLAWGRAVEGLQVSISAEKNEFGLGEPIVVRWRIRNVSDEDKTVIWHELQYSPVVFEIGRKGEKRSIAEDSRRMFSDAHPAPPEKIVLAPGDEKEATFDLRYFGLSHEKEGTYEITGLYSPKDARRLADYWLGKPEYRNVMTSRIASGTMEITLTKNPDWLKGRLVGGEFWGRLEAARLLAPAIGKEKVLAELEKMYPPENTRHMVHLVGLMASLGDRSHVKEVMDMYEAGGYAPYMHDYNDDMMDFIGRWGGGVARSPMGDTRVRFRKIDFMHAGGVSDGLELVVKPAKESFASDEDIVLDFYIHNERPPYKLFCIYPDTRWQWTSWSIQDSTGARLAMPQRQIEGTLRPVHKDDFFVIAPQKTIYWQQVIRREWLPQGGLAPGAYTLFVSMNTGGSMKSVIPGYEQFCRARYIEPWHGTPETGPIPLRIVADGSVLR